MSNHDDDNKDGGSCDCQETDALVPGPDLGDGSRPYVRHLPNHQVVHGIMRPVREGETLMPGAFSLSPRRDGTPICDVETLPATGSTGGAHKGPARVASPAYRDGWDRIFGTKAPVGQA